MRKISWQIAPRTVRVAILGLAAASIAACTGPSTQRANLDPAAVAREAEKQRELSLRDDHRMQARYHDVGFPILVASVPLCGDEVRLGIGAKFHNIHDYEGEWRDAARSVFAVGERLRAHHVVANSPAASAGLKTGDIVV